jgi:hypothetical protein
MSSVPQSPILDWFSNPWIGIIGAGAGVLGILLAMIFFLAGRKEGKAFKPTDGTWLFALVLGLVAIAVMVLQIESSNSSNSYKTEVALFSILQFVLSIGFAWVLSKASSRREFAESQKTFATAAYRRTREIEAGTNRLIARTRNPKPGGSSDLNHELEVILAIAHGIQQAVAFSAADWAEVIGEEIDKLEQIEEIKEEEKSLRKLSIDDQAISGLAEKAESPEMSKQLLGLEKQLEELRASLPPGLRVLAKQRRSEEERKLLACERQFNNELKKTGHIHLIGFWADGEGFGRSIKELSEGTQLRVELNDADNRVGGLMLTDESGIPIGIICNAARQASSYDMFASALCKVLGRSRFPVKIIQIDAELSGGNRIYFTVETMPDAVHPRRIQQFSMNGNSNERDPEP